MNVDHRRLAMIEAGDLAGDIRASWRHTPDIGAASRPCIG